jgi:predicted CXXCH cytochrome family protein
MFTKDPEILCLSCHPEREELSHPSGILPEKEIPEEFLLYKGKLICISCHIAHKAYDKKGTQQEIGENTLYMLRVRQTGKVFCSQCHRADAPENKADAHALAFQRAHSLNQNMSLKEIRDENSTECLSCHKDVAGAHHPNGIEYKQAYLKNSTDYVPPSSLNSRIRLINEKIGCQTCHDHYSEHSALLVIENVKDKLCVQCHNL